MITAEEWQKQRAYTPEELALAKQALEDL